MLDLSIVLPTCNRAHLLDRCLSSIAVGTRCNYEIIVVDGASTDATADVLRKHANLLGDRLYVIQETAREGFVRAANKGFRAAAGENIMWINDDARPVSGALDAAVEQLRCSKPEVGLLALFHRNDTPRNVAFEEVHQGRRYRVLHVRGTLYANFGMGSRKLFRRLNYFDQRFFLNAADPDFSLKVWHSGLRVVPAVGAMIDHDEHDDDRRLDDACRGADDNAKLFAKWDLPPKSQDRNDFDPANPCTLRGLRAAA